jgi:predicted nucleic acid-binding protein
MKMTLVDTSVWADHLRGGTEALQRLLLDSRVVVHPFVTGELSMGKMKNWPEILDFLANLPQLQVAGHAEVLHLVGSRRLAGSGLGWVDAHLIAAALLAGAQIMTKDKALTRICGQLGLTPR